MYRTNSFLIRTEIDIIWVHGTKKNVEVSIKIEDVVADIQKGTDVVDVVPDIESDMATKLLELFKTPLLEQIGIASY
jgi:hypothetical protein